MRGIAALLGLCLLIGCGGGGATVRDDWMRAAQYKDLERAGVSLLQVTIPTKERWDAAHHDELIDRNGARGWHFMSVEPQEDGSLEYFFSKKVASPE
jgi:hypothetical protein